MRWLAVGLFCCVPAWALSFDSYGGLSSVSCTASTFFSVQRVGSHLWFCTPAGHPFFFQGPEVTTPMQNSGANQQPDVVVNSTYVATLYGDASVSWANVESKRLAGWGFNGNAPYQNAHILPTATDSSYPGDHTIPTKLPAILIERPMWYGSTNTQGLLDQPIKDIWGGINFSIYNGYHSTGIGDYYDTRMDTQLAGMLNNSSLGNPEYDVPRSANRFYMLGMAVEDSDETYGFEAGFDFATIPAGHGSAHVGWIVASESPVQWANSSPMKKGIGEIYPDSTVYSKEHWQSLITTKYTTASALNTAWGSSYTTLGTSGTCRGSHFAAWICPSPSAAVSVGTGNGSTLTFSTTFTNTSVAAHSLGIFVAGTLVGGDDSQGGNVIYGPNLSGTINYSTGALSITFSSGHAPANSAAITAEYIQNGWGIGTGLMDEDARTAHSWFGTTQGTGPCSGGGGTGCSFDDFTGVNSNLQTDLNSLLYDLANWFFSHSRTGVEGWTGGTGGNSMSGILYMGPDSLFGWSAPPRAQVLQAAGLSMDVILAGGQQGVSSQSMLDFVRTNFGSDAPMIDEEFKTAGNDSVFNFPISSLSCSSGTVTITTTVNNTFSTGAGIQVAGSSVSGFNSAAGTNYTVASTSSATTFTFALGASCPASSATGGSVFFTDWNVGGYTSQAARGAALLSDVQGILSSKYSASNVDPYVGWAWWQFVDNPPEQLNWGLVTPLDNAYDGVQNQTVTSTDSLGYTRGGEPTNTGNMLSSIIAANSLWFGVAASASSSLSNVTLRGASVH